MPDRIRPGFTFSMPGFTFFSDVLSMYFQDYGDGHFSKSVLFVICCDFFPNGSPGQTTLLDRFGSKFCVEPGLKIQISLMESTYNLKTPKIVSWPECQPEYMVRLAVNGNKYVF